MLVVKRDGRLESVKFEKISKRLESLLNGLQGIDSASVAKKVIAGLYDGVTTVEIDNLAAEVAASMSTNNPDYGFLAARISISSLHKVTSASFSTTAKRLYTYIDPKTNESASLIDKEIYNIIQQNAALLDNAIDYSKDFQYDYFGFKTLERSYLMKINDRISERPQHMLMRVAIGIHKEDIEKAIQTYRFMSDKWFTHATPTLFNAGTPRPQLSSCFLLTVKEDSIDGIYETLKQCAKISKYAGGIGISIHDIRASGSYIKGTNGISNGIVPMLRNFDMTARYVDQGGGKRKGSFAIYIEPWHADIYDFLELKKNHGKEEFRARDLFYALWIPDLFMQRVEKNEKWSLFCPKEAPGLSEVYGENFDALYHKYEEEGRARKSVPAQELWSKIIQAQIETGTPYMLYKDACNKKSNQKNLGTIRCSNLCTEIVEYTSPDEVAVCNLASISLPKFVDANKEVDFQKLYDVTYTVTENLNKVIDVNFYPVAEAKNSNLKHRPIGIGIQGLADMFMMMRYPFDSIEARQLNIDIFETIYYAAMRASIDLAKIYGPYDSFANSPLSQGIFQFDMWGIAPTSNRWDWDSLRNEVKKYGARNSLLLAPMPTASTSQILGNNECFEPYTSNIYVRRVLSGEFIVVNKHLLRDLQRLNIWDAKMKNDLIAANGSVQNIDRVPTSLKLLYRTVWEIPQKAIIDMAAERGPYICQSQSLNIHLQDPTFGKITSMHFYAWKKGLKTGMYYLRTKAAADAIKFTLDKSVLSEDKEESLVSQEFDEKENLQAIQCSLDDPDGCVMCGS